MSVDIDMLPFMPYINSAKQGAEIQDAVNARRKEDLQMKDNVRQTLQGVAAISTKLDASSALALRTHKVAIWSLVAASISAAVAIISTLISIFK